jgi:hypothetical protein
VPQFSELRLAGQNLARSTAQTAETSFYPVETRWLGKISSCSLGSSCLFSETSRFLPSLNNVCCSVAGMESERGGIGREYLQSRGLSESLNPPFPFRIFRSRHQRIQRHKGPACIPADREMAEGAFPFYSLDKGSPPEHTRPNPGVSDSAWYGFRGLHSI